MNVHEMNIDMELKSKLKTHLPEHFVLTLPSGYELEFFDEGTTLGNIDVEQLDIDDTPLIAYAIRSVQDFLE